MKERMMYDPELKVAAEEIKAVLKKHSISGCITLCSKTHAEVVNHFPDWVAAKLDDKGGVRIQSKKEDYSSQEEQVEVMGWTVHMFYQTAEIAAQNYVSYKSMLEMMVANGLVIEYDKIRKMTPHNFTIN